MQILLVARNEAEAQQVVAAWHDMGLRSQLTYLRDAETASACLDRKGRYKGQTQPDIVIVPEGLHEDEIRELYQLDNSCFIGVPHDIGRFLRFVERRSPVSVLVLIVPHRRALRRVD